MSADMSQFYQAFFEEADELLVEKEKLLVALDVNAPDSEDLNAIFRAVHSIKGGAATFGFTDLTEVTHVLESLLDRIRKAELAITTEHVDAFLAAKDVLVMQLEGHRSGAAVDRALVAELLSRLQGLSARAATGDMAGAPSPAFCMQVEVQPQSAAVVDGLAAELALLGPVQRHRLDNGSTVFTIDTDESAENIIAMCSFEVDAKDIKVSRQPTKNLASILEETAGFGLFDEAVVHHVPKVAPKSTIEAMADPRTAKAERHNDHADSSSLRVSVKKVDKLLNLVGEVVIAQAMIEQYMGKLDPSEHERLLNGVGQLIRNTRDLQEIAMSIRMMPMDYVFSRFPRMVRDLASKLGKKIDLVTHGATTELDKGLIERIIDPLTHLVRNSIDHGIETPEARLAAGKNETGRLTLSAEHRRGNVVIEVADNGAGLNRGRILAKAAQQGLTASDEWTDAEVWQLIFEPGFSTAEVVTDVSGRGVGMDVVKRNIAAMGGNVDIRSVGGVGTTIIITLPLTLVILAGLTIRVANEMYILPIMSVIESLKVSKAEVKEIPGQGTVVKVHDEYLPLVYLYRVFQIAPQITNPCDGILVVFEADGKKAALLVDELVGQQQIVVKSLETNYRKVPGISGATILGDGRVSLILDPLALVRKD